MVVNNASLNDGFSSNGFSAYTDLYVGYYGSSNNLTISNGGKFYLYGILGSVIGYQSNSSANSILLSGAGSQLIEVSDDFYVGYYGSSNSLVISNGGQLTVSSYSYGTIIGFDRYSSHNKILVTGSDANGNVSALNDSAGDTSGFGSLYVGYDGSSNSLVLSNGGHAYVAGASFFSNSGTFIGYGSNSTGNYLLVTGTNANGTASTLTNLFDLYLGFAGSSNNLTVNTGGQVFNNNGYIGYSNTSSNNMAMVSGVGTLWSNSGTLTIGQAGSGTLTVANGGMVSATGGITIAAQAGSYGTLNIGSYQGSDSAGIISAPGGIFLGTNGTLNFNELNTTTLSNGLAGYGTIRQIGAGTTILSGPNGNFVGTTTISAGTLQSTRTNALGRGYLTLTNSGTLSLTTNLTINSLVWNTSAIVQLVNPTNSVFLSVTNAITLQGSGINNFDLQGYTPGTNAASAIELLDYGTNTLTTNQFGIDNVVGYTLITSNNALYTYGGSIALIASSSGTTISNTATYPQIIFQTNGILTIPRRRT